MTGPQLEEKQLPQKDVEAAPSLWKQLLGPAIVLLKIGIGLYLIARL